MNFFCKSEKEIRSLFEKLSAGGKLSQQVAQMFFGLMGKLQILHKMQPDFEDLELFVLYDLPAGYTRKYTSMMRVGSQTDEFKRCGKFIFWLQTQIESKQSRKIRLLITTWV
jgi:hypothetical protein